MNADRLFADLLDAYLDGASRATVAEAFLTWANAEGLRPVLHHVRERRQWEEDASSGALAGVITARDGRGRVVAAIVPHGGQRRIPVERGPAS